MSELWLRRDTDKKRVLDLDAIVRESPEEQERPEPPCRVLLHNDDVTSIEYVPGILRQVFRIGRARALWITVRAHAAGWAEVIVEPCQKAEARVAEAHERARADGHLYLHFTVEPVEE